MAHGNVNAVVSFKTKPFPVIQSDDSRRMAIKYKARVKRADCNLRAHQHDYFNSDMFEGMLNHAYRKVIGGEYKEWVYLDELPSGVEVDTSKFLAEVSVNVLV